MFLSFSCFRNCWNRTELWSAEDHRYVCMCLQIWLPQSVVCVCVYVYVSICSLLTAILTYCYFMLIQEAAAPISKKGFLHKTGSDRAGWKRRYCTLDRFRGFQYYKTETVSAPVQPGHCWREGEGGVERDRGATEFGCCVSQSLAM